MIHTTICQNRVHRHRPGLPPRCTSQIDAISLAAPVGALGSPPRAVTDTALVVRGRCRMNSLDQHRLSHALFGGRRRPFSFRRPRTATMLLGRQPDCRPALRYGEDELLKKPVTWIYPFPGRSSQQANPSRLRESALHLPQPGRLRAAHRERRPAGVPVNLTITAFTSIQDPASSPPATCASSTKVPHPLGRWSRPSFPRAVGGLRLHLERRHRRDRPWTYRYLSPVIEKSRRPRTCSSAGPSTG